MKPKKALYYSPEIILYPLLLLVVIWVAFWLDINVKTRFATWGIYPLSAKGLRGILFAPFIHGSLKHLFNNSVPLFALTAALFYFYRSIRWKVLLWGALGTGLLTWIIARPAMHIGASGIVYMLVAFLFFKGIFSRRYQLIAISLIVVFLYGGLLWYLFPVDPKISWEGHLSGFVIGLVLAILLKQQAIQNVKYNWEREDFNPEEDEFLRHFDDDGNFIEKIPEEEVDIISKEEEKENPSIIIKYIFKSKPDKKDS